MFSRVDKLEKFLGGTAVPRMSLKWFKILLTFVQILKYYLHIMPNAEKTVSRAKNVRKQRNMWEKLGNFKKHNAMFFCKIIDTMFVVNLDNTNLEESGIAPLCCGAIKLTSFVWTSYLEAKFLKTISN